MLAYGHSHVLNTLLGRVVVKDMENLMDECGQDVAFTVIVHNDGVEEDEVFSTVGFEASIF